jgi:hypothetical protein
MDLLCRSEKERVGRPYFIYGEGKKDKIEKNLRG